MVQYIDIYYIIHIYIHKNVYSHRQQLVLDSLRKVVTQIKIESQKCLSDYQRELQAADKNVASAEKTVLKSKEHFDKLLDQKYKLDNDYDLKRGKDSRYMERSKELGDLLGRAEDALSDDIRVLLNKISTRDIQLAGSRKAYQNLDRKCKKTISNTLKKLVIREKDSAEARDTVLKKLDSTVR